MKLLLACSINSLQSVQPGTEEQNQRIEHRKTFILCFTFFFKKKNQGYSVFVYYL